VKKIGTHDSFLYREKERRGINFLDLLVKFSPTSFSRTNRSSYSESGKEEEEEKMP